MYDLVEALAVAAAAAAVVAAGYLVWLSWNTSAACAYVDLARQWPYSRLPLPYFRDLPEQNGVICPRPNVTGRDVYVPSRLRLVESYPWGVRVWG